MNVEFVSANPTGPLHAGGGRWAAYGDSLCRILERCGYEVHREYYINDRGRQIELFAESLAALQAGEPVPEDGYQGQYVADWAAEMPADADPRTWGEAPGARRPAAGAGADQRRASTPGSASGRWSASGAIEAALADLRASGHAYEADGAVWLRATDFGLPKDEVLVKTGGEPTYLLGDIAYHRDKFERGFDRLIDIWGADHHGHVARLKVGMQALGYDPDRLEIILGQLVTLLRAGEIVRMGKRSGRVRRAGRGARRGRPRRGPAHVPAPVDRQPPDLRPGRGRHALARQPRLLRPVRPRPHPVDHDHRRRRGASSAVPLDEVDLGLLVHPRELELLRALAELPEVVADACRTRAPHKVTTWARELAGRFHGFYYDCYVMGEGISPELTQARLWLVEATRIGLAIGLDLLGRQRPESM